VHRVRPVGRRLPSTIRVVSATGALLLLGGCARKSATTQGRSAATIYNVTFFLSILVFAGVVGLLLYSMVKFKKPADDDGTLPPQTHGNTTAEIVWTVIPTIIVFALFGMSLSGIRTIDRPVKQADVALDVVVRGYQWNWTFDYGANRAGQNVLIRETAGKDGTVTPPEMVVPVGKTVHVIERSDNVIHSFFVPDFLFKRDVVPGRQNEFNFKVTLSGVYGGQCAEFCGTKHAAMTFKVRAVGYAEFDKWFQNYKAPVNCEDKATPTPHIESLPGETRFKENCVVVAASKPARLTFHNGGGLQHNVAIARGNTPQAPLLKAGKIIQSGDDSYEVPGVPKGDYTFFCQVHPAMVGTYRVQ
jgi:cytochrome c oxidase subunit 2